MKSLTESLSESLGENPAETDFPSEADFFLWENGYYDDPPDPRRRDFADAESYDPGPEERIWWAGMDGYGDEQVMSLDEIMTMTELEYFVEHLDPSR